MALASDDAEVGPGDDCGDGEIMVATPFSAPKGNETFLCEFDDLRFYAIGKSKLKVVTCSPCRLDAKGIYKITLKLMYVPRPLIGEPL